MGVQQIQVLLLNMFAWTLVLQLKLASPFTTPTTPTLRPSVLHPPPSEMSTTSLLSVSISYTLFLYLHSRKPPKLPGVGGNLSVVGFHRKECRATGRIGEAGHCRVSAFQLDSSHPPTSSGLGSQWRLSKPMVRVSQVYSVLGVDEVSVSALNQWRKAKVLTSHSLTRVNY